MHLTLPPDIAECLDPRRRQFLRAGVAGSALLLAGRWLPPARAAQGGSAAGALRYLGAADVVMLERVIPVMLEGALPRDARARAAAVGEILHSIDITIHHLSPAVRREIADLYGLLTRGTTRALIAGIWTSWENAAPDDIQEFLAGWRDSRFALLRSAYIGLNQLIAGAWYGNPRSWPRIGYAGPPQLTPNSAQ